MSATPPPPQAPMDPTEGKKPAAKRKPHRKSRTGCKQCRASRVKCDESKPSCSYCLRHSVQCSYLTSEPSLLPAIADLSIQSQRESPSGSGNSPHDTRKSSTPEVSASAICSNLHMKDLELLLHFNVATGPSIATQNPTNNPVWSTAVPQTALRHPFLMHGVFAIAALHLSYLNQHDPIKHQEYALLAAKHENIALPLFRIEAEVVTQQNCDAVFAFAALVVVYAMASPNHTSALFQPGTAVGDGLPEWLHLLRGVDFLTRERHSLLDDSPLKPLIDLGRFRHRVLSPTDEIYLDALNNLFTIPATGCAPERLSDLQIYQETLSYLRDAFTTPTSLNLPSQPIPYIFFTLVPERYLQLLRLRQPEALVLLAYECVILKRLEPLWFVDGVADRMMKTVMENLGQEWRPWVEWPLREMGLLHVL